MATIRLLLGMFCLVICWGFVKPSGGFLGGRKVEGVKVEGLGFSEERLAISVGQLVGEPVSWLTVNSKLRTQNWLKMKAKLPTENYQLIIEIARSQIGVKEATGNNDGKAVEAYLRYTGNKKGEPWCASFVSWVFGKAGYAQPKTAWSPAMFNQQRRVVQPKPAAVFGIYYAKLKRVAHCGLVESTRGKWVQTIEGNTNVDGSREGDGVYRKLRHQRTIAVYADWLPQVKKGGIP